MSLTREREFHAQSGTSGSHLDPCWEALAKVPGNQEFWNRVRNKWEDRENRPPLAPQTADELMRTARWPNHLKVAAIGDSGVAVYRKVSAGWKHRSIQSEINDRCPMYGGELIWHAHPGMSLAHLAQEVSKVGSFYRAQDAVICFRYLNGATTKDLRYGGEPEHLQSMMDELFVALKQHTKRCFLYLGGTAFLNFQLPSQWGDLVSKYVHLAGEADIPCSSGAQYDGLGGKEGR